MDVSPGLSLEILQKIQKNLQDDHLHDNVQCLVWTKRENSERCISNSEQVTKYSERFSRGHWTFLGQGDEKKWFVTLSYTSEGKWDPIAAQMVDVSKKLVNQYSRTSVHEGHEALMNH